MGKKEFSDDTRSRLEVIFPSLDEIPRMNPVVQVYGRSISVSQVFERVIERQPFLRKHQKRCTLKLDEITADDVHNLNKTIDSIPRGSQNVVTEFINVSKKNEVKFWHAEFKKGKYFAPRMLINLENEDIRPYDSVRINTGFIVRMPFLANARSIVDGAVVTQGRAKQPDFIIVPLVSCKSAHIIPSVYARDPDDTGFLTINFTLVSGKIDKLQVVFNAYITNRPLNTVQLIHPEPNAEVFKAKDSRSGRLVKNPRVKLHFDRVSFEDGSVVIPTFNALVKPVITYDKQVVRISRQSVLMTSRKREWHNPDLITLSGYFDGRSEKNLITPRMLCTADFTKNSHCMVFIESKATLWSESAKRSNDLKIFNGAFNDLDNYEETLKCIKQIISGLSALKVGFDTCERLSKKYNIDRERLMRLYDYHRNLLENEDELREKSALDDEQMFNSRPVDSNVYSANIYRALLTLIANFFGDDLTEEQRDRLKMSTPACESATKAEDDKDDDEERPAKRLKTQ